MWLILFFCILAFTTDQVKHDAVAEQSGPARFHKGSGEDQSAELYTTVSPEDSEDEHGALQQFDLMFSNILTCSSDKR